MKKGFALTMALSAYLFVSAGPAQLEASKIIPHVACDADAAQSYALYIPVTGNKEALPVIYCFDPHADGTLPLSKYKALADEYGFILIGSNNSKNGNDWQATEKIWQCLFNDSQKKLKVNTARLYTCGFSGGTKVAGYIALKYKAIKGVIANSAGLPDGIQAGNFSFSFTGLAGEGDMNMSGVVSFCAQLDNTTTRHCLLIFDGKHEWAPSSTMRLAFAGLQLYATQAGLLANEAFVNNYADESKKRLTALLQASQWTKAMQECKLSISFLTGINSKADWFKQQAAAIAKNSQYQKQQQQQQALMAKEQSLEAGYEQQFETGDIGYWKNTITGLNQQAAAKTAESGMYQRVLAWLSLAFYSISNQLIGANQNAAAQHFVELYKMADPANSEAWYFSAVLNARAHAADAAQNDLAKAVSCGFNDKARLEAQPEFKQAKINVAIVESKMK